MKRSVNYKEKKATRQAIKKHQNWLRAAYPTLTRAEIRQETKAKFFGPLNDHGIKKWVVNNIRPEFKCQIPMSEIYTTSAMYDLMQKWTQLVSVPPITSYAWSTLTVEERKAGALKKFNETGQMPTYEEFGCWPTSAGDMDVTSGVVTVDFEFVYNATFQKKEET